jgi:hypothetical protein
MKSRKMSPDWWERRRAFERQSAENLQRLRELVAKGMAELEERRRREAQSSS